MSDDRIAGIVLCGGQSRRMGRDKADLVFDGDPLLVRTVRTLSAVADPIVVAAAADQELPKLPDSVRIVHDRQPHLGPLAAFSEALGELAVDCEWTFLVGCDLPFLSVEYLQFLAERPRQADAIVPHVEDRWHALAALYRCRVKTVAERVVADGRRRMLDFLDAISVTAVRADEIAAIDPGLRSLLNVNTPEEFAKALREPR